MSTTTGRGQEELLHTQTSSEEKQDNKNSILVEMEPIPNTPFQLVMTDIVWWIGFKNYKILPEEPYDLGTGKEQLMLWAEEKLERCKWLVVMFMAAIIHETIADDAMRMAKAYNESETGKAHASIEKRLQDQPQYNK